MTVFIGVSKERIEALKSESQSIPDPISIRALVDTGASCTCIDTATLQALNLTPTGNVQLNTPSTGNRPVDVDQYDVGLIIPGGSSEHIPFFLSTLPVVSADDLNTNQNIHALIGRDILDHCILNYNGNMKLFTLAF